MSFQGFWVNQKRSSILLLPEARSIETALFVCHCVSVCVCVCVCVCPKKTMKALRDFKCQIFLDIVWERDISIYLGCYSLWTRSLKIFFWWFYFWRFSLPLHFQMRSLIHETCFDFKRGQGLSQNGARVIHPTSLPRSGCIGVPVEFSQRISDLDSIHQEPGWISGNSPQ